VADKVAIGNAELWRGYCLDVLRTLPDCSVDSIVTDPPYGLKFMGKRWDYDVPSVEVWYECLRVLKPGGHLLAFAGTRTQHRMACRIEDAGFEIRDMIAWVYGSGFPKSLDVSKAIDKLDAAEARQARRFKFTEWMRSTGLTAKRIDDLTGTCMGHHYTTHPTQPAIATREHLEALRDHIPFEVPDWVEALVDERTVESENFKRREVVGTEIRYNEASGIVSAGRDERTLIERKITEAHTDAARQWQGWGTALKPALEPITMARKPLAGTVAANVLEHGTGALNVDGCRVGDEVRHAAFTSLAPCKGNRLGAADTAEARRGTQGDPKEYTGRWPANLIHDGSDEVVACFPDSNGSGAARTLKRGQRADGEGWGMADAAGELRDAGTGSAARFFYCAKASKADRNYGLDSIEIVSLQCSAWENVDQKARLRVDTAQSPPRVIDVSGAPCNDASAWNTFLFGNGTTDQCQSGSRFTIETATSSTTESKTLSWLLRSNTSEYTAGARSATVSGGSRAASAETTTPCLTTTSEWMVSPRGVERAASLTRWTINGNAGQPCDHPTVKPTDLMRYLCRLVTPPGGVVLDPFMGSGSTGKAAMLESFGFIGIEREAEYVEIAKARIARAQAQGQLLSPEEPRECVQEGLL
jgi:DNA modification methylase